MQQQRGLILGLPIFQGSYRSPHPNNNKEDTGGRSAGGSTGHGAEQQRASFPRGGAVRQQTGASRESPGHVRQRTVEEKDSRTRPSLPRTERGRHRDVLSLPARMPQWLGPPDCAYWRGVRSGEKGATMDEGFGR